MTGRRGRVRTSSAVAAVAVLATTTGCYEHVVRSDRPDLDGPVHESDLESSRVPVLDDVLDALEGEPAGDRRRPRD